MQSSGGLTEAARFRGPNALLSGPAGGVVGAARVAAQAGLARAIGFDMGGTSTDVSLVVDGETERAFETSVAGVRVRAPMLRIHTVAAGGGSLCRFDGLALSVGPESAGAEPGPLCYGASRARRELALTDVNLFLGRVRGRALPVRAARARRWSGARARWREALAAAGHARSLDEVGGGLRRDRERAHGAGDPGGVGARAASIRASFALVGFGGAAGQHACAVARRLGIRTILLHPLAGLLSAYGIGLAERSWDGQRDAGREPLDARSGAAPAAALALLASSPRTGAARSRPRACDATAIRTQRFLDLRYAGAETALAVAEPAGGDWARAFAEAHRARFGYARPGRAVEVVTARVRASAAEPAAARAAAAVARTAAPRRADAEIWFPGLGRVRAPLLDRESLAPGRARARAGAGARGRGHARRSTPASSPSCAPTGLLVVTDEGAATARARAGRGGGARRSGAPRGHGQPLHVHRRADGRRAPQHRRLDQHQGAPRLLVRGVRRGRRAGRERAAHPGAPRRDGRDGARGARGDPRPARGRRDRHQRPGAGRLAPARRDGGEPGLRGRARCASSWRAAATTPTSAASRPARCRRTRARSRRRAWCSAPSRSCATGASTRRACARRSRARAGRRATPTTTSPTSRRWWPRTARARGCSTSWWPSRAPRPSRLTMAQLQAAAGAQGGARDRAARRGRARLRGRASTTARPCACASASRGERMRIDFTGTGPAMAGNLNAPRAVVDSAVIYALRCLVAERIPLNGGCLLPVEIVVPAGLAARPAGRRRGGGRQRRDLAARGGRAARRDGPRGGEPGHDEQPGVRRRALRLLRDDRRRRRRGAGLRGRVGRARAHDEHAHHRPGGARVADAGDRAALRAAARLGRARGAGRAATASCASSSSPRRVTASLLTERRTTAPFGLAGGEPGARGRNLCVRADGRVEELPGRATVALAPGDRLRIETPGGGGWVRREPQRSTRSSSIRGAAPSRRDGRASSAGVHQMRPSSPTSTATRGDAGAAARRYSADCARGRVAQLVEQGTLNPVGRRFDPFRAHHRRSHGGDQPLAARCASTASTYSGSRVAPARFVADAAQHHELRARDRCRRGLAVCERQDRILVAVDHERGHAQAARGARGARGTRRPRAPCGAGGVEAAARDARA